MDVQINNVIYMELNSGPKIVNSTCGKTINVETIDRDSTVLQFDYHCFFEFINVFYLECLGLAVFRIRDFCTNVYNVLKRFKIYKKLICLQNICMFG